jgi:hypothetical protein
MTNYSRGVKVVLNWIDVLKNISNIKKNMTKPLDKIKINTFLWNLGAAFDPLGSTGVNYHKKCADLLELPNNNRGSLALSDKITTTTT